MSDIPDPRFEQVFEPPQLLLPEEEPIPADENIFVEGFPAQSLEDVLARADEILLMTEPPVFAKPLHDIDAATCRPRVDDHYWHFPIIPSASQYWAGFSNILTPNPSKTAPPHPKLTYPKAPVYTLLTDDWRFHHGCAYYAPYYSLNKDAEREAILHTVNPPGVDARNVNGRIQTDPVEGMIEMPLGIPFGVALNGDLSRWVTVACAHNLDSLKMVTDAETFNRIESLSNRLWDVSWGADGCTPLYMLPGLERNTRSSKPPPGGGPDGSYNLASTLENRGDGITVPAVQANSTEARDTIQEALELISDLYDEIIPYCISREEHVLIDFRDKDMNVFSIGRPRPGPTSVQCNVSSASRGGALADFIGKLQGRWHADVHDHFGRWTLLILQFRLPPGSDMGAFLLARPGLYVRHEVTASGEVRLFLVFKGNDLHSGTAPTVDDHTKQQFLDDLANLYNGVDDQNRCVFVAYPNKASVDRSVPLAATAATGLGNDSVLKDGKDSSIHNYARDGRPALGNAVSHMTRLLWEQYARTWNAQVQFNVQSPDFVTTVRLLDGSAIQIPPPPLHPIRDYRYIKFMRSCYKRMHLDNEEYYMRVDKQSYRNATDAILQLLEADNGPGSTTTVIPSVEDSSGIAAASQHLTEERTFTGAPRLPSKKRRRGLAGINADDDDDDDDETDDRSAQMPIADNTRPRKKARVPAKVASGTEIDDNVHNDTGTPRHDMAGSAMTNPSMNVDINGKDAMDDDSDDDNDEYVLSRVLSIDNGVCLVRWRGFDSEWDSYLDEQDTSPELVREYRDSLNPNNREQAQLQLNTTGTCFKALTQLLDPVNIALQQAEMAKLLCQLERRKQMASTAFLDFTDLSQFPLRLQATTKAVEDAEYLINDSLGIEILATLQAACQMQGKTDDAIRELDAIQRALTHISCRSLVFIYHWQVDYGVRLASDIFALPEDMLPTQFPTFAPMATRIREFLQKQKAVPETPAELSIPVVSLPPGLQFVGGTELTLTIPNIKSLKLGKTDLDFKTGCIRVFIDFIAINSLAHTLKGVDSSSNVRSDSDQTLKAIYDRCLVRGAILDSVLDAIDDDGIFCMHEIRRVLETPWLILGEHQRYTAFAERLRKDPSIHLYHLQRWLRLHPLAANIQTQSASLGDTVRQCMRILGKIALPKVVATRTRTGAVRKRKIIPLVGGSPSLVPPAEPLSGLFPRTDMPEFGCLGIILLEVAFFLRRNGGSPQLVRVPDLQPVFSGLNPITNSKKRIVPDYFNPCRSKNEMHGLFCTRLAGKPLTSRLGLSNMLLFIGTGQGAATKSFVNGYLQEWFTSPSRCAQIFEEARTRFREAKAAKEVPEPFSNGNCWGAQFCSQLSLQDTAEGKVINIRQRMEEFFGENVCDAWEAFLNEASMLDEDMADVTRRPSHHLPTFSDALALGPACGVDGFGPNSLTNLQLANSLALLGFCRQPTVDEMGAQVFAIKKGGLGGLCLLGLHEAASQNKDSVMQAFRCVYAFMDEHLDAEHKELFDFGPIFVEHFLCKLKRWASLFAKVDTLDKARLKGLSSRGEFRELGYILPLIVADRLALLKAMIRL